MPQQEKQTSVSCEPPFTLEKAGWKSARKSVYWLMGVLLAVPSRGRKILKRLNPMILRARSLPRPQWRHLRRSFPFTVAGQRRICTVFPFIFERSLYTIPLSRYPTGLPGADRTPDSYRPAPRYDKPLVLFSPGSHHEASRPQTPLPRTSKPPGRRRPTPG